MNALKIIIPMFLTGLMILSSCTPHTMMQSSSENGRQVRCPEVKSVGVDTIGYTITFSDSSRREQFIRSFQSFLDHYRFASHRKDTVAGQVVIRLGPVVQRGGNPQLSPLEPEWISEGSVDEQRGSDSLFSEVADSGSVTDTIAPVVGGKIRIHLQRNSIDGTFLPLLAAPFLHPGDSLTTPLFTLAMASPKKVVVKLDNGLVDGTGRKVSALDFIEAWTGYIKQHPAEGLALFRHVEGVKEFIRGNEAVVRGFGATDQYTCYMKLSQADPYAVDRLTTNRTMGIYSKLGHYYPVKAALSELVLLRNAKTRAGGNPFLDTLIINISEDQNPILSFSLKKYDAVTLVAAGDVSYARTTLDKQADLHLVSRDRYFVSCICKDSAARHYIASQLKASDLLATTVKAEGTPIRLLEMDIDSVITTDNTQLPLAAPAGQQVRILYRSDDAVSVKIAEKMLADLSGDGVRGSLDGVASTEYERKLIEREYECAIGWVEENIADDISEKLRCATMYFNDMLSENERVDGYWEIPLFAVNRYLLMRKPAGLYRGRIPGIFSSSQLLDSNEFRDAE